MAKPRKKKDFRKSTSIYSVFDITDLRESGTSTGGAQTKTWKWPLTKIEADENTITLDGTVDSIWKDSVIDRPIATVLAERTHDDGSGNSEVSVQPMRLSITNDGIWVLRYIVEVYVTRHRWVYKLDGRNAKGRVLFSFVTSPVDRTSGLYRIRQTGALSIDWDDVKNVDHWVRRGVGEYRE